MVHIRMNIVMLISYRWMGWISGDHKKILSVESIRNAIGNFDGILERDNTSWQL